MPNTFDYTPEQLRSMSQEQLNELYYSIMKANPRSGTPLYDLADQVDRLADLAWAKDFSQGTSDYQDGMAELKKLADAADAVIKKLDNGAEILQGIAKVIGYVQQGVELAAKVAPFFALSAPGSKGGTNATAGNFGGYYGWKRDLPDFRDYLYGDVRKIGKKLPPLVDLTAQCSPVENQLALNSCTANALVAALEFLQIKFDQPRKDLSRLFLYYSERQMEGDISQDKGARIRDGVKCLNKLGVCTEDTWPYDVSKVFSAPPQNCYSEASKNELVEYRAIRSLEETRACLAEGFPVVFGFTVYEAFESDQVAKTGILNYPRPNEAWKGGHAIMAVGYNDKTQRLLIRNSWGWDWGQHGYFTMPYIYAFGDVKHQALGNDFWTLRKTQ